MPKGGSARVVPVDTLGDIDDEEYAVREASWNGVRLRVFHHPSHDVNVDRMIRSMRTSLAYYSRHFGPYQYRELSIAEFPRYASFARAHPHLITFSEGSAFLTRVDSGDVDRTFFVVAHETAHQWWGGQVVPAPIRGNSFVSESLAQYSAVPTKNVVKLPDNISLERAALFRSNNETSYFGLYKGNLKPGDQLPAERKMAEKAANFGPDVIRMVERSLLLGGRDLGLVPLNVPQRTFSKNVVRDSHTRGRVLGSEQGSPTRCKLT